MAFWSKKEVSNDSYVPILGNPYATNLSHIMNENFKGEVEQNKITVPIELGEAHPFDFGVVEGIYKKMGFVNAVIEKFIDFVVGPGFFVKCDDEDAKEIIETFIKDNNFDIILRSWAREALMKGNGFLEIGGSKNDIPKGMKVLNANYMYVNRDKKGVVEGYNQYKGAFNTFDKNKTIPFKPYQVAHIPFNKVGDEAYGLGVIQPAMITINNLLQNQKDLHLLMTRKANAPLWAKLGGVFGGKVIKPKTSDVTAYAQEMINMGARTEWATDGFTELKVVDFGNIGDKFDSVLEYDVNMLFYAFQIPAVIMGAAKVPEGLAKVQMVAFERRVQSIQMEFEKVIETQIFDRVLTANGKKGVHVEFEWECPSSSEISEKLTKITELIKSSTTSNALRMLLEKQVLQLLNLSQDEYDEAVEEEKGETERKEKKDDDRYNQKMELQKIAQTQKPVTPINQTFEDVKDIKDAHVCDVCEGHNLGETYYDSINELHEWLGFSFKKFTTFIVQAIKDDKFEDLLARNRIEIKAGFLTKTQIEKLRKVLEEGFEKGYGINKIAKSIEKDVKVKDLYRMQNGKIKIGVSGMPILSRSKEHRWKGIARTEVTRLGNRGINESYKKDGIKKVQWVTPLDDRTCPECVALDGSIFGINEGPRPALHPLCRCRIIAVTELN